MLENKKPLILCLLGAIGVSALLVYNFFFNKKETATKLLPSGSKSAVEIAPDGSELKQILNNIKQSAINLLHDQDIITHDSPALLIFICAILQKETDFTVILNKYSNKSIIVFL